MNSRDRTSTLSGTSRRRPPRILVIEDDRHVRTLLCDLLDAWGYEVHAAGDGREGLARFDPDLHDAVLTDFAMPDLSGLDVVAGVRERAPALPVLMLTGAMRNLDPERRRLGFRLLHKPLDIEGLRRAVGESLRGVRDP